MAKKVQQILSETESDLLNELQTRAAQMIATGISHKTTAERLSIHPTTISKWQRCPHFRAEINRLLKDARESTQRRLVIASQVALETLISVCTSSTASDRDKISAASQILSLVKPSPVEPASSDPETLKERDMLDDLIERWS